MSIDYSLFVCFLFASPIKNDTISIVEYIPSIIIGEMFQIRTLYVNIDIEK